MEWKKAFIYLTTKMTYVSLSIGSSSPFLFVVMKWAYIGCLLGKLQSGSSRSEEAVIVAPNFVPFMLAEVVWAYH